MFKKLSLSQLGIVQAGINSQLESISGMVTRGEVPTQSTDPNARAEAMVKLGNDFNEVKALNVAITESIAAKRLAIKAKQAKKDKKNGNTAATKATTPAK